ncbi:MAG: MFS transporter [Clostridiales bacterium]|nr:MFS transporter [Clostridiales bacterium]
MGLIITYDKSHIFKSLTDNLSVNKTYRERNVKPKTNYGKFLLIWSGELVSAIGGGLTSFGLGVYVFKNTGSAGSMALVTLLAFLPTMLISVPAGVLADRYDRRLLMIAGDGLSALGLVYILVCMLSGGAALYQICIGVFVSSVFSSLIGPSYRATVTDLLTREEYSKASGMMSVAGSARYLISPIIAGILLTVSDIKLLLLIDICTFFLTAACTAVVREGFKSKTAENKMTLWESFKEGWSAVTEKRGVVILIVVSSVMTCFMGAIQILSEPMILDFADSIVLGAAETICACGMLVSSVILGIRGLKKHFTKVLSASLILAGLAMVGFGLKENIYMICCFGFLFFFMLPFANNCLDYLVRTNIGADKQGRAWGLIGLLSQTGYIVAYGCMGLLADKIASARQIGVGRGAAYVIMVSGVLLAMVAVALNFFKDVRDLEQNEKTIDYQ